MIVECISTNWLESDFLTLLKQIDEELPIIGKQYNVIHEIFNLDNKYNGYRLLEIDTSHYGKQLYFNAKNFKIIDHQHKVMIDKHSGDLVKYKEITLISSFKY